MSNLEFQCPSCGKQFEVNKKHEGRKFQCPNCEANCVVRGPERLKTAPQAVLPPSRGEAQLETLRENSQAGEEKNAGRVANVIEKAQSLREECRFEAAANALGRIPQELLTQEASDLIEDCDYLAGQRETAMRSLKSSMDAEEYESGLAKTKEYRDSLEEGYLEDEEFSRAYEVFRRALKEQQEGEEAARQRRIAAAPQVVPRPSRGEAGSVNGRNFGILVQDAGQALIPQLEEAATDIRRLIQ